MSLSIPRKRKIVRVIIILGNRINGDLNNQIPEVTDTVYEAVQFQIGRATPLLFDVETWGTEHDDAWAAFESIYNACETECPDEQTLIPLSEAFGDSLKNL